jgi:hypothetical protein
MKSIKKMTAIMILAAVATLSTPQAFASTGIMLGDRATTGTNRNGIMLGDYLRFLRDVTGIMLGD